MPDYAEMYKTLFHAQTKAINLLQQAQRDAEEIYIASTLDEVRPPHVKECREDKTGKESIDHRHVCK